MKVLQQTQILVNIFLVTFFTLCFSLSTEAQSFFDVDPYEKSHFYVAASYFKNEDFSQVSINPLFEEGSAYQNAIKIDVGYQFNKHCSVELGHIRQSLWLTKGLKDGSFLNSASRSMMDYFSISLTNQFPIVNDRLKLKFISGYTLGRSTSGTILGSSRTTSVMPDSGRTLSLSTLTYGLESGNQHYLNLGAGLEVAITNRISFSANYYLIKGFKDLIRQDITYDYGEDEGEFAIVSDGSIGGLTLGLKYNFNRKRQTK